MEALPAFEVAAPPAGRALFQQQLDDAVAAERGVAVLFVDVDSFRNVNDAFGRPVGDALLDQASRRLAASIRDGDTVSRFGGDEFAIVCPGVGDGETAAGAAERVRRAFHAPFALGDREFHLTASVGCRVLAPGEATDPDALLRDADAAMYQAKDAGRDRVELYSADMHERLARRLQLSDELRRALERDELALHFQPHIELSSGRIVGAEALLRWTHPELGPISPASFIPLAEQSGVIGAIGAWVLEQAARRLAGWHAEGRDLSLSVNVSAAQLSDPGFAALVESVVATHGVAPEKLCLELTESALMQSSAQAIAALERLRQRGHYIAIDDFGTGYSSLAYLTDLPVEILKIDRHFVDGLGTEPEDSAVVASIMSLAHAMGLHVVAEGIETAEQACELSSLGCTVGQGFLFARPVPAAEFDALWRAGIVAPTPRRRSRSPRRDIVDEMMHQIGIPEEEL